MPEVLKVIILIAAIVVSMYGYIEYGIEVYRRKVQPRPFTWLIWGVLSTCIAIIQIENGAAYGAVGAVLGALSGYVLGGMAWYYGKRRVYDIDILSITLSVAVFVIWALSGDAVAVVAASLIYLMGFTPTIIRAWKAPHKESRTPFLTSAFKHTASLAILGNFTFETMTSPIILALANIVFVTMLYIRRK